MQKQQWARKFIDKFQEITKEKINKRDVKSVYGISTVVHSIPANQLVLTKLFNCDFACVFVMFDCVYINS